MSEEDENKGYTRFYRWHIDAALYDYNPPRVTTLYAVMVPQGPTQTVRYDDGTGDTLQVPLGTTAFVSGKTMFDILPSNYKSLAVRAQVKYAPHPYVWMAATHALPTGLGIENEGLEESLDKLPPWEESKVKILPMVSQSRARVELMVSSVSLAVEEPGYWRITFPGPSLCCQGAYHRPTSARGFSTRGHPLSRWYSSYGSPHGARPSLQDAAARYLTEGG